MRLNVMLAAGAAALATASQAFGFMPSPLQHAPVQVESYLTRLAEAADFSAVYAELKAAGSVRFDNFPLSMTRTVTLDVQRFEVLKSDARIVNGSTGMQLPRPDVVLLRGTADGDPTSSVFLSLSPHGHQGWVTIDGEQYFISSGPANGARQTVVYRLADIPPGVMNLETPVCGGALATMPGQVPGMARRFPPSAGPAGACRVVEVAVDTDFEFTSSIAGFEGDPAAATAYITTLFGAINEIYQREFSTQIVVPYVRVFGEDTDPYPPMTNVPDRLDQLLAEWNANQTGVDRKLTHMLTAARVGGVGGIAYLGVVCWSEYGYGVSGYINGYFPYPLEDNNAQNWDVVVTAHEIGHNFNAPHTHDVEPPIDLCAYGECTNAQEGTIMSYCHTCRAGPGSLGGIRNISLDMHPRIIDEFVVPFLDYLVAEEVCDLGAGGPVITQNPQDVTAPLGGTVIFGVGATGAPTLEYQWYRNGSVLAGATEASLVIESVGTIHAGSYFAVVSNDCGAATSSGAELTIFGRCYADFNEDLVVDFFDYLDFVAAFSGNSPAADVNADGVIDFFDYLDFLDQFSSGC